jgi:hypothetical protein
MLYEQLTKQEYDKKTFRELLKSIQDDKKNMCSETYETIPMKDDEMFESIHSIFSYIYEDFLNENYGKFVNFMVIYNNILIWYEYNTDYDYSNLQFLYKKEDIDENDMDVLKNIFAFMMIV